MSLAARLLGASAWRANLPRCASAWHPLLAGASSSPSHDASSANAVSGSRASVTKAAGDSAASTWAAGASASAGVFRGFAASAAGGASGKDAGASATSSGASSASSSSSSSDAEEASSEQPEGANVSAEELLAQLKEKESAMDKLREQVESATDHWKRSLAEMENVRQRTAREVDNSKKFAIQGFVKSILDVVDNLERAAGVVPQEALSPDSQVDKEKLRALLKGLLDGVQATEKIMLQVLKQHNVERYDPLNQQFDPTLHNALFEVPDPTKAPGTVAVVTKRGYKLNDRVVRPADVGVVRAAE